MMDAALNYSQLPLAEPEGEIRIGVALIVGFFVILLGWAAFVPLDAAVYAQGSLQVEGQRKSVQHRDGGVVGEILVRDGQQVRQGDLLVRLNAAEVVAQERALSSEAIRELARRSRLEAEEAGLSTLKRPPEFDEVAKGREAEADAAMRVQQGELLARRSLLQAQRGSVSERVAQATDEGEGYRRQRQSADEQIRLLDEELAALAPLAERGFVARSRIRALERARAELVGQRGRFDSASSQSGSAAQESRLQVLTTDRTFRERMSVERREVDDALAATLPKLSAARVQLAQTEIRAPTSGAVVGLSVFTPGGVIAAGQRLMDIVPKSAALQVQVRVSPDDADDLNTGQRVLVRFPGLHERSLPDLEGKVVRVSADSFTDEATQQSYFTAQVVVPDSQVAMIRSVRGGRFALRAGMPAEVLIPLRHRTALSYLLEPLTSTLWPAFRQH